MTNDALTHLQSFTVGALAACGAVTFTNPWEVVKTRMQLQGELNTSQRLYNNAFSAFIKIFKTEGISGVQKGLGPAYIYQWMMNGIRLGFYEPMRNGLYSMFNWRSQGDNPMALYAAMVTAGASTGTAGAFVASPFFLVKTRMQSFSSANPAVGHQHHYIHQGLWRSLYHIWHTEGIRGLWRGSDAAMLRTAVGSAVQLSTYDSTKRLLLSTGLFDHNDGNGHVQVHFSASLLTSFFVCVAMSPFDVAMTRVYNQKTSPDGKHGLLYRNALDCLVKTVKNEGVHALYKGFFANFLRIGPHTILTFVFLEQLKALVKV